MRKLTAREVDTVLAALRWYQETPRENVPLAIAEIASNGGKWSCAGMTNEEIGDLWEAINLHQFVYL